ncbi:MAG: hypothetical protein GY874_24260, partial [Desulfobacteraceae bacterium]|nr:hypothetical protein [Desulfobacteraceae bacterium]
MSKSGRGPSIVLSSKNFNSLVKSDPNNPLLRRHLAVQSVIKHFLKDVNNRLALKQHSQKKKDIPKSIKDHVLHINTHYLNRSQDLKISHSAVWKVIYRSQLGPPDLKYDKQETPDPCHRTIYVQHRHLSRSEQKLGRLKRVKPICGSPLGQDYSVV